MKRLILQLLSLNKCAVLLLAIVLLLHRNELKAQVVTLNGIYISTGSGTFVKLDTLRINNTSTVDNAGTHTLASLINDGTVQGNGINNISNLFTNTGTFTPNNSTFNFNGGTDQDIPGLTFNHLTLSNSSIKTLAGAITAKNITINPGATLDVSASNYNIDLSGDWTNDGTFTPRSGTVTFNGGTAQTLGGAVSTTFKNININNNAGISLTKSQSISGALTFSNGVITTTATNILTMLDGSSVSGAGTGKYINGPLRKNGNSSFTFPVGKSGVYAPVGISAPGNSSDAFTAEYQRISPRTLSSTITAPGVSQISNCEYWQLDRTAGSSNVNVSLSWSGSSPCNAVSYITDLATLTVVHYNGTSWDSHGNDGGTTGNISSGTVTWNNVSTFSPFTLGSTSGATNPLPVKFNYLKAVVKNQGIQLDWGVLTEISVEQYEVERSANGQQFIRIGSLPPSLNNGDKASYSWLDVNPGSGMIYYRIKVKDLDGKITYSAIVRVNLNNNAKEILLYPNPVVDKRVSFETGNLVAGQYLITVNDMSGRKIYYQSFQHPGGAISQSFLLPSAALPGIYSLKIMGASFYAMKTFFAE